MTVIYDKIDQTAALSKSYIKGMTNLKEQWKKQAQTHEHTLKRIKEILEIDCVYNDIKLSYIELIIGGADL